MIGLDIETYSNVDLSKCGVYRYAESPDFEITLLSYSIDGADTVVIDLLSGEDIPDHVLEMLMDNKTQKWAFNASFERICLSRYFRDMGLIEGYLDPGSWYCSLVLAAYNGLPLSLKGVGTVLGLEKQKLEEGKDLIRYFCMPCRPTKKNKGRTRNLPEHDPEKWEQFKSYNKRDTEVELSIRTRLKRYPVPDYVWNEYHDSERINDRGIMIDSDFAKCAVDMDLKSHSDLAVQLQQYTGIENANSVSQLKSWLEDHQMEVESLDKKHLEELIETAPDEIKQILKLRQEIGRSSVKKYTAMLNAVCMDGRCHGMFFFYGANRTGRFAGRIVQLQNLFRNSINHLDTARDIVKTDDYDLCSTLYDSVPELLAQLVRTSFVPKPGCKFIVADYSSIEARVLAWLSGETHTIEAFANGEDIYCSTASAMFGVPVVKHGVNGELRQKGKIATLACGYGGSTGALISMGALNMGLAEEELKPIVDMWRSANPHIVKFWYDVDKAVKTAIKGRTTTRTHGLVFSVYSGMLFITLPSGRRLAYVKPGIGENRFGGESITYWGVNGTTRKWERIETFGGKLVENITQAVARDILCYAITNMVQYNIVAHIHDEVICEVDQSVTLEEVCEVMSKSPSWAEDLLLRADGYECAFYQKD